MFIALEDKPARTASADEVIARLRPEAREGRRASSCSCSRCRTSASAAATSRTQYQYTLAERRPRRARDLGAEGRRGAAQAPRGQGRRLATSRPPGCSSTSRSIATPRRASASRVAQIDNTLYDAFGQRQVATFYTAGQPVPRGARGGAVDRHRPRRARSALRHVGHRRAGAARPTLVRVRPDHRRALGQPPGPVPGDDDLVQPRARRRARPGDGRDRARGARRSACRRASTASSRAPRRRSATRCRPSRS